MIRYAHILAACANEIWAMQPEKLQTIVQLLAFQASGQKYTAEEIQARISKQDEKAAARRDGAVAILPLRGTIANRMNMFDDISGGTSSEGFGRAFQAAVDDEAVKAVIADVDSPGGIAAGCEELSALIFNARGKKPLVAHVNSTCASAAFWIASAFDEVVITPSGQIGSVGVLGIHEDVSKALEKLGVTKTVIAAGEFKAEQNPFAPLSDEAKAHMQTRVDYVHGRFIKSLAQNRGVSQQKARDDFGRGRMFFADEAIAAGMADRIGTLEETLQRFGASQFAAPKKRALGRERRALALEVG